jgi:hypothetical protein
MQIKLAKSKRWQTSVSLLMYAALHRLSVKNTEPENPQLIDIVNVGVFIEGMLFLTLLYNRC